MARDVDLFVDQLLDHAARDGLRGDDAGASLDAKTKLLAWAPAVIDDLLIRSPDSPTTRTVGCFVTRLLNSRTDSRYVNRDRAQRIIYNTWHDFVEEGHVDSLRADVLHAAKWSRDWQAFGRRVVALVHTVRNGLGRIADLNNVWGDASAAVRRMHAWAMDRQQRSNTILSCYL
jgi:hypothetical protein